MGNNQVTLGGENFSLYLDINDGAFTNDEGGILFLTENKGLIHYYLVAGSYCSFRDINIRELYKKVGVKKVNFCLLVENDKQKRIERLKRL